MTNWRLYRNQNRDGSSKDWAVITNPDGSVTTRWGKTTNRLAGLSTRNGLRQFDIENQKQNKGYRFIGEVTIDDAGNVAFPMQVQSWSQSQNQNKNPTHPSVDAESERDTDNNHSTSESPRSRVDTLYWHIDCQADHDTGVSLGIELQWLVDELKACTDCFAQAGQDWDGWQVLPDLILNRQVFTHSGQIQQSHGVKPWLLLMALKFKDFAGVDIGIATEHSREVSADLKAEPELLAFFGTDLDSIRPLAERLGLLKPKLNLALAMAEQDDRWF